MCDIPQNARFALALSGGGYRAALFHLGAVRRLNELGVLSRIGHISSVSGGRITAAHLAVSLDPWPEPGRVLSIADWEERIARPLRAFCARNIRTAPLAKSMLLRWPTLGRVTAVRSLAHKYHKHLLHQLPLSALPAQPRFEINATELIYGVRFAFEKKRLGCYEAGYLPKPGAEWTLGLAVAASSCFPPLFPPLNLGLRPDQLKHGKHRIAEERKRLIPRLALSDGGVYDNLGVEPVWDRSRRTSRTYLFVSDGGSTIKYQEPSRFFAAFRRYIGVPLNQVGYLRTRWLRDRSGDERDPLKGVVWSLGIDTAEAHQGQGYDFEIARQIARIRTDLDAFSDGEMAILENQGYLAAAARIRERLPELIPNPDPPFRVPPQTTSTQNEPSARCGGAMHAFRLLGATDSEHPPYEVQVERRIKQHRFGDWGPRSIQEP